ncbi:hypothetical protein FDP41_009971 [Naegleria fowleri]|uniref:Uncharacterized protein n=1 Tax=Naegleria fowleri TaxID=5763 RepID=A0A6A5BCM3_NAEFO|nr:uncharacterized protein FDP41_009971 [Naegleria fowleri]KAF0971748.1 hypothetical protein FDP41_009971 [Naegleria fowleri]
MSQQKYDQLLLSFLSPFLMGTPNGALSNFTPQLPPQHLQQQEEGMNLFALLYPVISSVYFNTISMGLCASGISLAITLMIEKWGSRVGGVIGSIPTAVVPSTMGFALNAFVKFNDQPNERKHVMIRSFYSIPIGTLMTALFLLSWKVLPSFIDKYVMKRMCRDTQEQNQVEDHSQSPPQALVVEPVLYTSKVLELVPTNEYSNTTTGMKSLLKRLRLSISKNSILRKIVMASLVCLSGVGIWSLLAVSYMTSITLVNWNDTIHIMISCVCFILHVGLALTTSWSYKPYTSSTLSSSIEEAPQEEMIPSQKSSSRRKRITILALRVALPFCLVSFSVLLNAMKLTLLAGLAASFPTLYMTTLFTLWIGHQDERLAVESVGPMVLGSASVSLYAIAACPMMLSKSLVAGSVLAYSVAVGVINVPAFFYLNWRKNVHDEKIEREKEIQASLSRNTLIFEEAPHLDTNLSNTSSPSQIESEYTHEDREYLSSVILPTCTNLKSVESMGSLCDTASEIRRSTSSESLVSSLSQESS